MSEQNTIDNLYKPTGINHKEMMHDPEAAHLVVHHNEVLGKKLVPGLNIEIESIEDGINAKISVDEGIKIQKPVHICFGMLPEQGIQRINMDIDIKKDAKVAIQAHCVFPNALDVQHIMNSEINVAEGAEYSYFESHVHSKDGGIKVYPTAKVKLGKHARFKTEFELLKGRVGIIDIDYETTSDDYSVMEMTSRIDGKEDDIIKINETGYLIGKQARGVLTSKIAVRDNAKAEVYNKLIASGEHSIGHVDCKEVIKGNAVASAFPMVEVKHPKARVTHEASIGSVDNKQLETLMARGLTEEEASDLIIEGLLS